MGWIFRIYIYFPDIYTFKYYGIYLMWTLNKYQPGLFTICMPFIKCFFSILSPYTFCYESVPQITETNIFSKLTLSDNLIQELYKSWKDADSKFYDVPESHERESKEQSKRSPKFCHQGLNGVDQSLRLDQQVRRGVLQNQLSLVMLHLPDKDLN